MNQQWFSLFHKSFVIFVVHIWMIMDSLDFMIMAGTYYRLRKKLNTAEMVNKKLFSQKAFRRNLRFVHWWETYDCDLGCVWECCQNDRKRLLIFTKPFMATNVNRSQEILRTNFPWQNVRDCNFVSWQQIVAKAF